ncbi:hypothetical protein EHS25_009576 [Saitozyma podzolica]|uniref:Uncharacterized protein n=1 Tax=Saitozyma podzolica TaxID=1890683 RepID=A0A427YJM7_9TREE|nr:hypothetical protein EHS25_009576 [Saitozyma podzolica]
MPRSPAAKPKQFKPSKPTTYSRLPAKSSKHYAKPTPPPSSSTTPPALTLDKHLVLQIILAKLESSKSCDWHELSLKLSGTSGYAKEGAKGGKKGAIKAKAREKKDVAAQGLSGTELREMYHDIILPSLRSGRALWTDDTTSHIPVPLTPVSASAETPTTITTRDQKFIQEGDSDEDVASNDESMDETTNTKVSGSSPTVARPTRAAKARKSYAEEYVESDAEQSDESMGSESE